MLKKLGGRVAPMNVQLNPEPDLNPGPKKGQRKQTPVMCAVVSSLFDMLKSHISHFICDSFLGSNFIILKSVQFLGQYVQGGMSHRPLILPSVPHIGSLSYLRVIWLLAI